MISVESILKKALAKSGYKPNDKKENLEKHKRIRQLKAQNSMAKEEIARAFDASSS